MLVSWKDLRVGDVFEDGLGLTCVVLGREHGEEVARHGAVSRGRIEAVSLPEEHPLGQIFRREAAMQEVDLLETLRRMLPPCTTIVYRVIGVSEDSPFAVAAEHVMGKTMRKSAHPTSDAVPPRIIARLERDSLSQDEGEPRDDCDVPVPPGER